MTKKSNILLILILLNTCFGPMLAQQKFNAKGQNKGVVIIKFKPQQTEVLDRAQKKSRSKNETLFSKDDGYIKTGITSIDTCNKKLGVQSMKRVFRHAGKFEAKHRKHGLHLWYEIHFKEPVSVDKALSLYQKSEQIQIAHASYKTEPFDVNTSEKKGIHSTLSQKHQHAKTIANKAFPNDPRYNEQWHYHNTGQEDGIPGSDIKLEKAWDIETGDSRVIVSIMDYGVDANHPDLDGNMWVNSGEIPGNGIDDDDNGYVDDINGYNFAADTGTIVVTNNHGTHIAGTIAAETNNGIGVAGIAGGTGNNDGVRIMSNAIHGGGSGKTEEAFVYAADNGAVISQNSWNSGGQFEPSMQASIDYFIAEAGGPDAAMDGGILFFSAGNNNSTAPGGIFPGAYEKVFSVAATDNKDKKSNFSNYGAWVNISAPGGESTSGKDKSTILSTVFNNRYGFSWGTSMATPHVSGVAALIISHNYGAITPEKVKKALLQGVDPIDHLNAGYEGKLGAGRLNALRSLRASKGLGIPENLSASNITVNGVKLNWDNVSGANQYGIRYKLLENTQWTETSLLPSNTYDLNNLEKGTIYEVQVWAKNSSETSYFSSSIIFATTIDTILPPSSISFSNITGSRAEITWSKSLGATIYEIAYKPTSALEWLQTEVREVDSRFTQLRNLMGSTEYLVKIRGKNETLTSEYSSISKFTTQSMNCNGTPFWVHTKAYNGGDIVVYDGSIYKANWYSEAGIIPEGSRPWSKTGECTQGGGNVLPTVSITAPNDGQVFEQETLSAIILSANASDSDGTIASVQFEVNGTALTQGNNINWTPTAFGNYTIKVTATDDKGATGTHQISITVNQKTSNQVPTVNITQPNDGQIFEQETLSSIILSANASDSDGTITNIQFEVNGTALTQGNNISWTPTAFGNYTIKVTATDDKGATAIHQISITVNQKTSNQVPTVNITQPNDGQVFEQETLSAITLSANATDSDGTIVSVQFEVNDTVLTQGNNISWTPTAFGNYTIKVTATDDKGATAKHQISIMVNQKTSNQVPTVNITQPNDGQVFEQKTLSSIILSANATDSDGTITNIQFEVNGNALTQGNNISWTPTAFGDYTIKVTATDDKGATATHQISITVKDVNTGGDCNGIPAWDSSTIYPSTGGVKVSHKNMIYQNKWWTQNNEPGTGGPWGPWELVGPCSSSSLLQKMVNKENFTISPNPASNLLNIRLNKAYHKSLKIMLYDITGKYQMELKSKNLKKNTQQLSYDISQLPNGLYILKINSENQFYTQKIIIK